MTPEEAYEEALRRVREAEATETSVLNLSSLDALRQLPQDLERLTGLRVLDLSKCRQLSGDLSPLAGLTSLQTLNLMWCERLSGDLSALAGLTSLQTASPCARSSRCVEEFRRAAVRTAGSAAVVDNRCAAGSRCVEELRQAALNFDFPPGAGAVVVDRLRPPRVIHDSGTLDSEHIPVRADREGTRQRLEGDKLYGCA
jgi:hypothetical protein